MDKYFHHYNLFSYWCFKIHYISVIYQINMIKRSLIDYFSYTLRKY